MTTTENEHPITLTIREGIYLLKMTTTENLYFVPKKINHGIDLLGMTTIENEQFNLFGASLRYLPV